MNSVGADVRITGLVQGVGYRYFCYRVAIKLGLVGWVRNNPDGSVSIHAEGDRSMLEEFIAQLKVGPSHAVVRDVSVTWTEFSGKFSTFDIVL